MVAKKLFTPWSGVSGMLGKLPDWMPEEEQERWASYEKYDQMYWNDPTQYSIRVLEDEQPLYIPNPRVIVDTTAQYLLKGLKIVGPSNDDEAPLQKFLEDFLKREKFYSQFHIAKQAGIARGDWAFHITADPSKPEGSRVSWEAIHPGMVIKVPSDDDPDDIIRMHVVQIWLDDSNSEDPDKQFLRKLTYEKVQVDGSQRIWREEAIFELEPKWYGPEPTKVKQILAPGLLPPEIDQFPIYWFPNIEWDSQLYGSSELRGLEYLSWAVSQGATDTQAALALEGLGVYATDGGRPVDDDGVESDWEVAPGKVMEVSAGSYFRRVEGVGSITPMMDQIKYLEAKAYQASGTTDVARGEVDVQVAQSGIALAIKFLPTQAKIEVRDLAGQDILNQMFFDLKKWFAAYENVTITEDIEATIAVNKLPVNRTETINELNNMFDRKIISREYYRTEVKKLGYQIPENMDEEILEEARTAAEIAALSAPPALQENAQAAAAGVKTFSPESDPNNGKVDKQSNRSNNRSRPNESSGTESGQTLRRQTKS